jgi:hypothetical protein
MRNTGTIPHAAVRAQGIVQGAGLQPYDLPVDCAYGGGRRALVQVVISSSRCLAANTVQGHGLAR